MTEENNYINTNDISAKNHVTKTIAVSTVSIISFILGIFAILVPGFGFYIGIAAIIAALCDISRELFIFDRVKSIWLDLSAIVMGLFGIMEMVF